MLVLCLLHQVRFWMGHIAEAKDVPANIVMLHTPSPTLHSAPTPVMRVRRKSLPETPPFHSAIASRALATGPVGWMNLSRCVSS